MNKLSVEHLSHLIHPTWGLANKSTHNTDDATEPPQSEDYIYPVVYTNGIIKCYQKLVMLCKMYFSRFLKEATSFSTLKQSAAPKNSTLAYALIASNTFFEISSRSKALRAGKGRFIPFNSTMGSSIPTTLTMKLPFPGFSLLISTFAAVPTALEILFARLLNAPHCLQASMITMALFFVGFLLVSFVTGSEATSFFGFGVCFSFGFGSFPDVDAAFVTVSFFAASLLDVRTILEITSNGVIKLSNDEIIWEIRINQPEGFSVRKEEARTKNHRVRAILCNCSCVLKAL